MKIKALIISVATSFAAALSLPVLAAAAPVYNLFGEASMVSPGNGSNTAVKTVSDDDPEFGGIDFNVAAGTTFADLTTLSADYNITDDDCGDGSPRFQINLDTTGDGVSDGNVQVAIGPSPNFTDCPTGWQSTGNLIGNNDAGRYDFSQFGGSPFTTYSNAPANVLAGTVVGVQLVTDGGWSAAATGGDGEQTVLFDNVVINSVANTFEPEQPSNENQCKKDGWKSFGGLFKNQGDCVSFVATQGRNQPSGSNGLPTF